MNTKIIAGIDEVGRGCIVGPVFAAAVILAPNKPIVGLTDSKKIAAQRRLVFARIIKEKAHSWAVGRAEASEIDRLNILQASLLAMSRAISQLSVKPEWVKVDGNFYPDILIPGETIVRGDCLVKEISAASILAKVARDDEMSVLDQLYPGYGFLQHKGYPTKHHLKQLQNLGVTEQHRKSFSPVQKQLLLTN